MNEFGVKQFLCLLVLSMIQNHTKMTKKNVFLYVVSITKHLPLMLPPLAPLSYPQLPTLLGIFV